MSIQDNFYNHLRLKPYIKFDKNDYMRKLFIFDGTKTEYDALTNDVYRHKFMFVFDMESQSFIWTSDLRDYIAEKFGDLVYRRQYVKRLEFDEIVFKVIIVNVYAEKYMTITEHSVSSLYYTYKNHEPRFNYKSSQDILLFYDSKAVKYKTKLGRWMDLSIAYPIDFCKGLLLNDMPEFSLVSDMLLERLDANNLGIKGDLTYSQILISDDKYNLLSHKFKTLSVLEQYVDVNELNYWEIGLFFVLKQKLTSDEFEKLTFWYKGDGRNKCFEYWNSFYMDSEFRHGLQWEDIYLVFLVNCFGIDIYTRGNEDVRSKILDYFVNHNVYYKNKAVKLHVSDLTYLEFREECYDILIRSDNMFIKSRYKGNKISLNGWRPLLRKMKDSGFNIKPLLSLSAITKNANDNQLILSFYIFRLIKGKALAFDYCDFNGDKYTVLFERDNKGYKFSEAYQEKDNSGPIDPMVIQSLIDVVNK